MEKKNNKTLMLLFILILIFIFTLIRALKPAKPKTITVGQDEKLNEIVMTKQDVLSDKSDKVFDFQQIDMSMAKLQSIIKNIEEQEKQTIAIETNKNPFKQPGTQPVKMTSATVSILEPNYIPVPDFKISGIIYDKERPMAIIDDEVKAENEIKSGYKIHKILADRVILQRENKEFVLFVNSSISAKNIRGEINMSDVPNTGDTEIFAKENKTYSILKNTNNNTNEKNSIERVVAPEVRKKEETIFTEMYSREPSINSGKNFQKILTVQVASFGRNRKHQAIEFAKKLQNFGFENVRVEKIDGIYTVRVGNNFDRNDLTVLCQQLKQFSETSFIRTAYLIENRIIYPPVEDINL